MDLKHYLKTTADRHRSTLAKQTSGMQQDEKYERAGPLFRHNSEPDDGGIATIAHINPRRPPFHRMVSDSQFCFGHSQNRNQNG